MAKCSNRGSRKKRGGKKRDTNKDKSKKRQSKCPRCGGKLNSKSTSSGPKTHYYRKWVSRCFETSQRNGLNLAPQQTIIEAARCWMCLTEEQLKTFQDDIDNNERRGQPRSSAPASSNRPSFGGPSNGPSFGGPSVVLRHSQSDIVSRPAPAPKIPRNPHGLHCINHPPLSSPSTEFQYNLKSWTQGKSFP